MPFYLTKNKLIIGALALSLITGSGVVAPTISSAATTALSTPFTDINKGHWAEKHVAKLALQGIITGYPKGDSFVFLPTQSVTQEEAVLMALRFAGLEKKADLNAIIGFPESFVVSNFFKPYVKLAFSEGLLDQTEEYALAAKDPSKAWGKRPASREWVTKLMILAIGKEADADRLQDSISTFDDANEIDPLYNGYVNAASELELVKGVTDVKFAPKANVNRAQLATLFSRAEALFPVMYEGQSSGVVSKITDNAITVYSDKKETTYSIDSSTLFYHYKTEVPITLDQLYKYGDVTVISKEGRALYVEIMSENRESEYTKTITGKLGRVVPEDKKLYVWVGNDPVVVYYDDSVVVVDEAGNPLLLSALKADSQVSVVQDTFRESPHAIKIVGAVEAPVTSVKGSFYNADKKTITISDGTALISKFFANDVTVEIEGMKVATISDLLKDADQVELTLNATDQVTKVKVTNRNVKQIAGAQIVTYSNDKKLLTIVDDSGAAPQALFFNDRTKIEYGGSVIPLSSALSFLTTDRKVIISYTGNTIVSLEFLTKYTGTLVSINTYGNLITVKLNGGTNISLPYNTAYVDIAGATTSSVSDLKTGDMLTLQLNDKQDKVATISLHKNAQYEVVSFDTATSKLRLKNSTTPAFDLSVSGAELLSILGTKLTLNQFTPGTMVNASYVGKQATNVQVVAVTYGKVLTVAENSVTIKDLSGKTVTYSGGQGFDIIKGSAQSSTTNLLTVGDYVEVLQSGTNKTTISIAIPETRVFSGYYSKDSQIQTVQTSGTDNRYFFTVTADTKYTYKGNPIVVTQLKSGDNIIIYGFKNKAIEIVKL